MQINGNSNSNNGNNGFTYNYAITNLCTHQLRIVQANDWEELQYKLKMLYEDVKWNLEDKFEVYEI